MVLRVGEIRNLEQSMFRAYVVSIPQLSVCLISLRNGWSAVDRGCIKNSTSRLVCRTFDREYTDQTARVNFRMSDENRPKA